ncbi:trans-sialidase, partial [Trypanosoma cruzi]
RTAQSFHCGHSVGITRCGGVRKSRSPDGDGLVVVWWLRTSGPSPFRIALLLDWRSTIHRSGPAAVICDLNSRHELRDGRSASTTAGDDLAATPIDMESKLSDDPAQATRISGRSVSFPT